MAKKKKKQDRLTPKFLENLKVPKVLIAGLVLASVLGWTGWMKLKDAQNYYKIRQIFPTSARATEIQDGDTFTIDNGLTVRLLGIDARPAGERKDMM